MPQIDIENKMGQLTSNVSEKGTVVSATYLKVHTYNNTYEIPHLKGHMRNPIEFLNLLREYLKRINQNRWETGIAINVPIMLIFKMRYSDER